MNNSGSLAATIFTLGGKAGSFLAKIVDPVLVGSRNDSLVTCPAKKRKTVESNQTYCLYFSRRKMNKTVEGIKLNKSTHLKNNRHSVLKIKIKNKLD